MGYKPEDLSAVQCHAEELVGERTRKHDAAAALSSSSSNVPPESISLIGSGSVEKACAGRWYHGQRWQGASSGWYWIGRSKVVSTTIRVNVRELYSKQPSREEGVLRDIKRGPTIAMDLRGATLLACG